MAKLPAKRSENVFEDFKPAYDRKQALAEANRCLYCLDAPCITVCPTHINIPEFIRKIATDNVKGSARTIFDSNILGMSCARVCPVEVLCVGDCVYNDMGIPPIQIGKLQRYATDVAYEKAWRYFEAGANTGRTVGLIGAGPASLACAHELRRYGHGCTIYEKRAYVGGLNTTGVAPYKMRADRSVEEAEWVLAIGGIDVRHGVTVGESVTWTELEERHDALFLGMGLGPDRMLGMPGEDLEGISGAVDAIEEYKTGVVAIDAVKQAVVLGGGNTAIDAVRALLGLGVPIVYMVYRGDESTMSGYLHEWGSARKQSARAIWRAQPVGYEGDGGRVTGVRCIQLDESKQPLEGTEFTVEADLVLLALGQSRLGDLIDGLDGVELDGGRLVVDENGATGRSGVYAGGDLANGGKEVVNAVAEGKAAAQAIHQHLGG